MSKIILTKSDFKIGHDCLYKLKYKKKKYPSKLEENEYLSFFADCGFMVEAIAHAIFSDGITPTPLAGESLSDATKRVVLKAGDAVWFEPTFIAEQYSARIDMMVRSGSTLRLIEIKAKSFNPEEDFTMWNAKGDAVSSEWESYLIDIAFQTMVVRLANPGFTVIPELCLVDKSKTCSEEAIYNKIQMVPRDDADRSAPRAIFVGDSKAIIADHFLIFKDVSEYVDALMPEVEASAKHFVEALENETIMGSPPLSASCKKCEYRGHGQAPDGFGECWGVLASVTPHILDLYYASSIGGKGTLEDLVEQGLASIFDAQSAIDTSKARGIRQMRQIVALQSGQEQVTDDLVANLDSLEYPLFFLDFETSRIPVPYHVGMNPYEQVTFQFSCHVVRSRGSTNLEHFEWINTQDVYPNFEFAAQLRSVLGDSGTIIVWSPFEQTAIKDIVVQAKKYEHKDSELIDWLSALHVPVKENGRIFDLMRLCESSYYHPEMNGRVGLKFVLKAIWQNTEKLWGDPWFSEYFKKDAHGKVLDPYMSLSAEPFAFSSERTGLELEVVREGVGAMRTYQEMLYGQHRGDKQFEKVQRELLLQYCKLDTAAMVIIWKYWSSL